jgi:hydroxymethylbilane synthase
MAEPIRIGTRDSALALWQAEAVQQALEALGHRTELVPVKSEGDLKLDKPLYALGITGVFTKVLDMALLEGKIDIAVHSMKDVPTQLAVGLEALAVLPRASTLDVLVHKGDGLNKPQRTIATSSLRRKAQWLAKYPNDIVVDIRGNVPTRLQKLQDSDWDGAIFAQAGLERLGLAPEFVEPLTWMLPAPAQGAVVVVGRQDQRQIAQTLRQISDADTERCTWVERQFLRTLEGGCTAPIGALAQIEGDQLLFKGCVHALDGSQLYEVAEAFGKTDRYDMGCKAATELLAQGADDLIAQIKRQMRQITQE